MGANSGTIYRPSIGHGQRPGHYSDTRYQPSAGHGQRQGRLSVRPGGTTEVQEN